MTVAMILLLVGGTFALNAQTDLFTEGFDGTELPEGWIMIDAAGDGHNWIPAFDAMGGTTPYAGEACIASSSYDNAVGQLHPDNWLISPQLNLGGSTLTYYVCAQDAQYAEDHYGVFISTTGINPEDFTLLFEETLTAKSGEVKGGARGSSKGQGAWYERTIDLSAYAGNCYIAFRHFDCSNWYYMLLDEVSVTLGGAEPPIPVSGDANGNGVVDVADVTTVVAYILEQNPQQFIFDNADCNSDGTVNVLDITSICNIIMNSNSLIVLGEVNHYDFTFSINSGESNHKFTAVKKGLFDLGGFSEEEFLNLFGILNYGNQTYHWVDGEYIDIQLMEVDPDTDFIIFAATCDESGTNLGPIERVDFRTPAIPSVEGAIEITISDITPNDATLTFTPAEETIEYIAFSKAKSWHDMVLEGYGMGVLVSTIKAAADQGLATRHNEAAVLQASSCCPDGIAPGTEYAVYGLAFGADGSETLVVEFFTAE